jgi:hypothetical protein
MRLTIIFVSLLLGTGAAFAQYYQSPYGGGYGNYGTGSNPNSIYHQGYMTRDGAYVAPHYQTAPNTTQYDNYGTRGNYNPYSGAYGTQRPRY